MPRTTNPILIISICDGELGSVHCLETFEDAIKAAVQLAKPHSDATDDEIAAQLDSYCSFKFTSLNGLSVVLHIVQARDDVFA